MKLKDFLKVTLFVLVLFTISCAKLSEIKAPLQNFTKAQNQTGLSLSYGIKYKVKVVKVIDGDTIDVEFQDGSIKRIRMLGVDTPETKTQKNKPYEYDEITNLTCLAEWGIKAKNFTSTLYDKYIHIEFDPLAGFKGYYGRYLAYVYYPESNDFTAELIKKGLARVYTEGTFIKEAEYMSYQMEAMNNKVGLWGACSAG